MFSRGRGDDHGIGKRRSGLNATPVLLVLARPGIFRKLDRDQIMDQANERHAVPPLQPRDETMFFEVMVRYQQVYRFGRIAQSVTQERLPAQRTGELHAEVPPIAPVRGGASWGHRATMRRGP